MKMVMTMMKNDEISEADEIEENDEQSLLPGMVPYVLLRLKSLFSTLKKVLLYAYMFETPSRVVQHRTCIGKRSR